MKQIYNELKAHAFPNGYFLCHPIRRDANLITYTAVVVSPVGKDADFEIFCNNLKIHFELDNSIDMLQHVVLRLDMPAGGVRRIKFKVKLPTHNQLSQIYCRQKITGENIGCSYYLPSDSYQQESSAEAKHMLRAIRTDSELYHLLSGFDDCEKIKKIITDVVSEKKQFQVLDWGVGSGRVAGHMRRDINFQMHGVDIDPVNMDVLHNSGFSNKNFRLMAPGGDIPFGDESFDAVYGISVFTHLTEDLQFKYLKELKRVLNINGVGIFSIHGFIHFFSRINDGLTFYKWMERGLLVTGDNHDLTENFSVSNTSKLYVDTLHSPNYIYENWSRIFSKIRIIKAPNAYGHDLVVCQK